MNKDKIEAVFAAGGLRPVLRQKLEGYDLFIGDGFSMMPHAAYQRFGIGPDEFPSGMYVTFWWLGKDEQLDVGHPLFFTAFHDPEYSTDVKQTARINAAIKDAKNFLKYRKNNVTKH